MLKINFKVAAARMWIRSRSRRAKRHGSETINILSEAPRCYRRESALNLFSITRSVLGVLATPIVSEITRSDQAASFQLYVVVTFYLCSESSLVPQTYVANFYHKT